MIERSIQSMANQGVCRIPKLPVNSSEIAKFYTKKEEPIDCSSEEKDWVTCEVIKNLV